MDSLNLKSFKVLENNMGKYTADDNRSMQLNDNNERYYSSRGIDHDDLFEDEECETNTVLEEDIMLFEFDNQIINTQRITSISGELIDLTIKTVDKDHVVVYPTVRIAIHTDFADTPFSMDFTPAINDRDGESHEAASHTYSGPTYSCYLPIHDSCNPHRPLAACFDPQPGFDWSAKRVQKKSSSEEAIRADINETLNTYTRFVLKCMIEQQKNQLGGE